MHRPGEQDRLHPPDPVRPQQRSATCEARHGGPGQEQGIKGFVLDLRFNPGGLLRRAVEISDLFIDDGLIVSIRPRVGQEHSFTRRARRQLARTSRWSAWSTAAAPAAARSSSACLQDHNRAIIIGERSYGKGSVQNIIDFERRRRDQADDRHVLAAQRQEPEQVEHQGHEDEDVGRDARQGYLIKLTRKERDDLAEAQRDAEIIPRRDLPTKEVKRSSRTSSWTRPWSTCAARSRWRRRASKKRPD